MTSAAEEENLSTFSHKANRQDREAQDRRSPKLAVVKPYGDIQERHPFFRQPGESNEASAVSRDSGTGR